MEEISWKDHRAGRWASPQTFVPDVTIDKRHTSAFTVGQSAVYTIVVRNIGNLVPPFERDRQPGELLLVALGVDRYLRPDRKP